MEISQEDRDYINYLNSLNNEFKYIFTYSIPWLGLGVSTFALLALIKRSRLDRRKNLLIYIFQWQYAISIIYWLNIIFNDYQYSRFLFNYSLIQGVPDLICKLSFMLLRFIYCASPWIQVV